MSRYRLLSVVVTVSAVVAMVAASGAQAGVSTSGPHRHHHARKHHRTKKHRDPTCVIHSLPSFVESGLGGTASSAADVVTVECHPVFAEDTVTITSDELFNRCGGGLSWIATPGNGVGPAPGPSTTVRLDNDGEATVVAFAGPSCAAGSSDISAHLNVPPFATVTARYRILAPQDTPRGVFALPSSEVEDSVNSSVATIVYAEFNPVFSERTVRFRSNELADRCDNLTWIMPGRRQTGPTATVTLDNNGNAWAIALAGPSCAAGKSQIEASLTSAPYKTYLTWFNILSPRVTNP
jgi:hypothetical protein